MNRRANGLPSGPRRVMDSSQEQAPKPRPLRSQKSAAHLGREELQQAPPRPLRAQTSLASMSSLPSRSLRPQKSMATFSRPPSPVPSQPHARRPSDSSSASWSGSSSSASSEESFISQSSSDSTDTASSQNHGNFLWDRVAGVASALTVNVSKAWAANISLQSGEETPPGGETRLSRALKAYHLDKARDPADLPAWLFDEHERRSKPVDSLYSTTPVELPRSMGLRDVYAAATAIAPSQPRDIKAAAVSYTDEHRLASKATDRLKALRDAKRANYPTSRPPEIVVAVVDHDTDTDDRRTEMSTRNTPPKRMGLPARPKRV